MIPMAVAERAFERIEHEQRDLAREGVLEPPICRKRAELAQGGRVLDPDFAQLADAHRADILETPEVAGHRERPYSSEVGRESPGPGRRRGRRIFRRAA